MSNILTKLKTQGKAFPHFALQA